MKVPETDRFIEAAVRRHQALKFHVNPGNHHCVELDGLERKGGLWITPRKSGYRVQTTGQAQRLDRDIERLCGTSAGSEKEQMYQFWNCIDTQKVEKIIGLFAQL